MRIYYLDLPPNRPENLHLRRRFLYGDDVVLLSDAKGEGVVDIGPVVQTKAGVLSAAVPCADLGDRVSRFLKQHGDGVLVVGSHRLAIAMIGAGVPFAFDPTDSNALFFRRRISPVLLKSPQKIANSVRLFLNYSRLERRILENSPCFVISGRADEAYLRRLCPEANILRIENGTELIEQPPVTPQDDGRTIGFHGYMPWEPNHTAADVLSGRIAAALSRTPGPPLRIRIGGRDVPDAIRARDGKNGVEMCGYIDDLRAWLASLSLYVMPMVLGGGVKNKLIEAMAAGVPVLTNRLGAESLPPACLGAIAIVKSEKDWAARIRKLLSHPDELSRMRREGRRQAAAHFSWRDHRAALHAELTRLHQQRKL